MDRLQSSGVVGRLSASWNKMPHVIDLYDEDLRPEHGFRIAVLGVKFFPELRRLPAVFATIGLIIFMIATIIAVGLAGAYYQMHYGQFAAAKTSEERLQLEADNEKTMEQTLYAIVGICAFALKMYGMVQ